MDKENLRVLYTFDILIVVTVLWVHIFVKTHQVVHLKYLQLIFVRYSSKRL